MANIKSQKKRIRTNEAARMRNKAVKSELKTLTKHGMGELENAVTDRGLAMVDVRNNREVADVGNVN